MSSLGSNLGSLSIRLRECSSDLRANVVKPQERLDLHHRTAQNIIVGLGPGNGLVDSSPATCIETCSI